jgi:hypothetical protein
MFHQIVCGFGPACKVELKAGFQKPPWNNAPAF